MRKNKKLYKIQKFKLIMEKIWPIPTVKKHLPKSKHKRGFARNHEDKRFHAGVDILAPFGSDICAIENGVVRNVFLFTYPELDKHYKYKNTHAIAIEHDDGNFALYCEIQKPKLKIGDKVKIGQKIAKVGMIFADKPKHTMLHFEYHNELPKETTKWYAGKKPKSLLNPTLYLKSCLK